MRSPSFERGTGDLVDHRGVVGFDHETDQWGASVGSVVIANTLTDVVASKRSSCRITTGRDLPTYPLPAAGSQVVSSSSVNGVRRSSGSTP
jgi:hypothetical protein